MNLYIARHGETDANREGRYLGELDVALNETGRHQAELLRSTMPNDLHIVIVSPLLRARQTAQIAFRSSSLPQSVVASFRERSVGVFEGLTQEEAKRFHPQLWERNCTRTWRDAPTGGETIEDVAARVVVGLNTLIDGYAGNSVALIAHGFVAKVIRALTLKDCSDFFDWKLENGKLLHVHLPHRLPTTFTHIRMTLPGS